MSKAAKGVAQPGCNAARRHLVPFVISEDEGGEQPTLIPGGQEESIN